MAIVHVLWAEYMYYGHSTCTVAIVQYCRWSGGRSPSVCKGSGGRSPPVCRGSGGRSPPELQGVWGAQPPSKAGGFGGPQAPQLQNNFSCYDATGPY